MQMKGAVPWARRAGQCSSPRPRAMMEAARAPAGAALDQADRLSSAAARGDLVEARRLLEGGADPNGINSYGRSAIQVMMIGNPQMAELLIQKGADPNRPDPSTGSFPAHDAAHGGFLDTLRVLRQGGARLHLPDYRGRLPIDLAAENGWTDVVVYLSG